MILDKVGDVKPVIAKRKRDDTTKYIINANGSLHLKKYSLFMKTDWILKLLIEGQIKN